MLRFDLQDLKLVSAVARAGSISAGAAVVHLAVASASERLKLLEASVGAPLFRRSSRGVVATTAGRIVLRHAQAMLGQADALRDELTRMEHSLEGEVRIAANSLALTRLSRPLITFLQRNPAINVRLSEVPSTEAIQLVRRGKVDFAVASIAEVPPDIAVQPLFVDVLVTAVSSAHPLSVHDKVSFADVLDFQLLLFGAKSALQQYIRAQASALTRTANVRVEIDDLATLCRMAAENIGVGIVPLSMVSPLLTSMALKALPLSEPWSERRIGVLFDKARPLGAAAREIVELIFTAA